MSHYHVLIPATRTRPLSVFWSVIVSCHLDRPCPQVGNTLKICKKSSRPFRVWFPTSPPGGEEKPRTKIYNLDVLIRIKRNLNNTEGATRSTPTLGEDLTHVASLAESFSRLRSRTGTVNSDLVDALDREGQFFFSFFLNSSLSLTMDISR